jgi:hypothetical protein
MKSKGHKPNTVKSTTVSTGFRCDILQVTQYSGSNMEVSIGAKNNIGKKQHLINDALVC